MGVGRLGFIADRAEAEQTISSPFLITMRRRASSTINIKKSQSIVLVTEGH